MSWRTPGGLWKRSAASWPGTLLLAEPDSYEQAVECYRAVVNELRRTGNGAESIAKALHNQALADLRLGRFERAKAALRDCAALAPNGGLDQPV